MDVFIPEDYVRKRRLEKKLASSTKGSHSHWNLISSNERINDNKDTSFTHHHQLDQDTNVFFTDKNHLFIFLSA